MEMMRSTLLLVILSLVLVNALKSPDVARKKSTPVARTTYTARRNLPAAKKSYAASVERRLHPVSPVVVPDWVKRYARLLYREVQQKRAVGEADTNKEFAFLIFQIPQETYPVYLQRIIQTFFNSYIRRFPSLITDGVWPFGPFYDPSYASNMAVAGVDENKANEFTGQNFNSRHAEFKIITRHMISMDDFYYEKTNGGCPRFILLASMLKPCASDQTYYSRCAELYISEKKKYMTETECPPETTTFYVYVDLPNVRSPAELKNGKNFWPVAKEKYCAAGIGIITRNDDDADTPDCIPD